MGISHPLSDEYDALRGAVLSPDTSSRMRPCSPPSPPDHRFLEHEVNRMDTLAGIAIKYGVEIPDIKRANSLVTDSQMFAHKTLLIPLPGRPMPPSVKLDGSDQRTKRARAQNHQQYRDAIDSSLSGQQGTSPAMNTLQRYYGLTSQKGGSTEMSVYHNKGSFQQSSLSETLLNSSPAPGRADRSWRFEAATDAASETKGKQDGSMRRRQKVEADSISSTTDTQDDDDDFLSDPIKVIKSLLPRPVSSIRMSSSGLRKSPSAPSFENGVSLWSRSKWTCFNYHEPSFTRPLLVDGLPKPVVSARRTKAAMD